MDELKDNIELYAERENEILLELGKTKPDDPKYATLMKHAEAYSKIRSTYEENENTRLNNNARNDIEEARLVIENEKLINERQRIAMTKWQTALYFVGTFAAGFLSYNMDLTQNAYKWLDRQKDRFLEFVKKT